VRKSISIPHSKLLSHFKNLFKHNPVDLTEFQKAILNKVQNEYSSYIVEG
jgi:hypothetical protein